MLTAPLTHAIAFLCAALLIGTAAAEATSKPIGTVKRIATVAGSGFRADLIARKSSGEGAPTAAVTLSTYRTRQGRWQKLDSLRLTGTFFWKSVTGLHAICRFELATAVRPHVTAEVLASPALGCGKARTVQLPRR
jgi:hypothetical protein